MSPRSVLGHAQSRVIVACPADDEIEGVILYPNDDFLNQHANDSLARRDGRPLGTPSALDVCAKPQQRVPFGWARARRLRNAERVEFLSTQTLLLQALVPTPFQFARDQPVVGIDGVVLPSGQRRLEAGLLQRQFYLAALGAVLAPAGVQRRQRRLNAERLEAFDHLGGDTGVNA
jgi:hypothetical protein